MTEYCYQEEVLNLWLMESTRETMIAAPIVHFLGLGAIGTLYATGLQKLNLPIRAILSSSNASSVRSLKSLDGTSISTTTFERDFPNSPISHLIVSTKAQDTVPALRILYPRIDSSTCILLLQNGALAVQTKLIQDLETAGKSLPQFVLGSTTHGVAKDTELNSHPSYRHTGIGNTFLGTSSPLSESCRTLLDQFSKLPSDFNVRIVSDFSELKKQLLIKVVVNSCLNCLSSLFLVRNGLLVETEHGRDLIRQLILESHSLLERDLEGVTNVELERIVMDVASKTSMNRNSMMVDVINGSDTEIDYFLGHLLDLARQRNISIPKHQFLYSLTCMKADLVKKHPEKSQIIE